MTPAPVTTLYYGLIEAPGLRGAGEVVIYELSPLHHEHGELLRVVALVPVDQAGDEPGVGQRTVGH